MFNPSKLSQVPVESQTAKKKSGLTLIASTEAYHSIGQPLIVHVKVRKSETKKFKLKNVHVCVSNDLLWLG